LRITKAIKTKLAGTLVVVLIAVLAVPTIAAAQQISPTSGQYNDTLNQAGQGVNQSNHPNEPPSTGLDGNVGPLPFTGFDVIAMAAVALAVTGLGLALQRAVSRRPGDLG
jgi:hypothetical protein